MKVRISLPIGLSALLFSVAASTSVAAGANANDDSKRAKFAAHDATNASTALAHHDGNRAVAAAEAAVALSPHDAGYRLLLGQSYLAAGRFASARQAFTDTLALTPDQPKAALNLALAEIATGDWASARHTLDTYAQIIPMADRGLAIALAGDPSGAVAVLTQAARLPGANAKVRQNLALAYALDGDWPLARAVASADLSTPEVDARLGQWAAFAQPRAASDQVAALLGVKPAIDAGQPTALALAAPLAPAVAVAEAAPVPPAPAPAPAPRVVTVVPEPLPIAIAPKAPEPAVAAAPAPSVTFAAPFAVVQPLPSAQHSVQPVKLIRSAAGPIKVALGKSAVSKLTTDKPTTKGKFVIQLGAFQSAGVAKAAWLRAERRFPALASHQPDGSPIKLHHAAFYRLSVGNFARNDATILCARFRSVGGACFVRASAGEHVAAWVKKPTVQLAAR